VLQLEKCGIEVTQQIPTGVHMSAANVRYLAAKAAHSAHTIDLPLAE
jgi:GTP cyclohydrolase II